MNQSLAMINIKLLLHIDSSPIRWFMVTTYGAFCSMAGSGELFDGIERHGPHYVYWCYRFERMVSDYGRTRTNQKDQEVTYSLHFARRFFTKISSYIWEDDDGLFPHQRALIKLHKWLRVTHAHKKVHKQREQREFKCPEWHEDCVAIVSNQGMALELWDEMQSCVESDGCKNMVLSKGVGVGSTRKKMEAVGTSTFISLKQYWHNSGLLQNIHMASDMSDLCTPLRSVVWRKQVYRRGDHVVVARDGSTNFTKPSNWKAVIQAIFMHEFMGQMELFFEAAWYKQKYKQDRMSNEEIWDRDEYSQFTILEPKPLQHKGDNCRLVSQIVHKFFPVHRTGDQGGLEVVALEVGDTLVRELPETIGNCPPFPEVGDIMSNMAGNLFVVREVVNCVLGVTLDDDEAILAGAADESSDDEEYPDESRPQRSDEAEMGKVNVSWLYLVGPRGENQEYRASVRSEECLSFETLLCNRSGEFCVIKSSNDIPVRWAQRSGNGMSN